MNIATFSNEADLFGNNVRWTTGKTPTQINGIVISTINTVRVFSSVYPKTEPSILTTYFQRQSPTRIRYINIFYVLQL